MNTGVKVRAALLTAVSRKAFYMPTVSVEAASDIVGFVANDIGKVYDGIIRSAYLIDADGRIEQAWPKISPKDTPIKLLAALEA